MGLYDIFNKKKKERERQELLRLQEEETKRRAEELHRQEEAERLAEEQRKRNEESRRLAEKQNRDEDATNSAHKAKAPKTSALPINEAVSEQLQYLASQANWSFNIGNQRATIKYMNELFDACYGSNGYKLLQVSDESTQVLGLAFTNIARHLDFNDQDLNSVAAENAIYCLARNLIAQGNTFCAPAIFTLLLNHSELLRDKLIATHGEIAQKDIGMPIGMMLGGNPFNAPHLNYFRKQAISKRVPIMAYILTFFYNEDSREYKVPTDIPYHIPSQTEINRFIKMKSEYGGANDSLLSEGQRYFYQMFEECQDTLLQTKSMFTKIFGESSTPKPQQEQRTSATTGAPSENKIAFQPFSFHSDCHQRYNNDVPEGSLQVCGRSIKVEKNTNGCSGYNLIPGDGYIVRATNDDTGKPQFSPKPMRIVKTSNNNVLLRGYKTEAISPFGWIDFDGDNYGFEVFYENGNVTKCVLYMYDRNVRLEYMRQSL